MKIFATNYLEPMSEDIANENEWTWNSINGGKGTGVGTKTKCNAGSVNNPIWVDDHDMPAESPSGSMLVA